MWYDANVPFNAANSKYYQPMIDAISVLGSSFKAPSFHDLRGRLWKDCVHVQDYLLNIKRLWKTYGCSVVVHEWTNQKQESIVNFLVYCSKGTIFLKSVDASGLREDAETFLEMFDEVVQYVGPENIVQFVTDKDACYESVGRKLKDRCSLVINGWGQAMQEALLGVRFLEDRDFWFQCQRIVKISEPLLKVLRFVDGEERPSIGYLWEAMEKEKGTIRTRMKNRLSRYMPYVSVIDERWDNQLRSPLHAAGCFLNPAIFFIPGANRNEITKGLLTAITRLVANCNVQDMISAQLVKYKQSTSDFGLPIAIRNREKIGLVGWWRQFGNECPELQNFAIRVLSQCASATGFEWNLSAFEFFHSKRRNRLEHKRLNDLVFFSLQFKASKSETLLDRKNPRILLALTILT